MSEKLPEPYGWLYYGSPDGPLFRRERDELAARLAQIAAQPPERPLYPFNVPLGELPGDGEATLAHDEREHEDMSRPPGW